MEIYINFYKFLVNLNILSNALLLLLRLQNDFTLMKEAMREKCKETPDLKSSSAKVRLHKVFF